MSASRKKTLRREENRAAMTERQQKERKDAKQLKLYTAIFAVVIVLMIGVVIYSLVSESGIIERNTTALTVNDEKISAVELNYYYIDSVNNFVNSYGSYASLMGLDPSLPLNEQYVDEENQQTWADYMLESSISNLKTTYALYQDASANGYTLPEETLADIETSLESIETYAALGGYPNSDTYLSALYGPGSNLETYRHYTIVQSTATNYNNEKLSSLAYTDEDLRAAESENYNLYSSYSYNYYYLSASDFYEGGTTDENGTTTFSDEEKAAGAEKAKQIAVDLTGSSSLEELDTAIGSLEFNADVNTAATTAVRDRLYTSVESALTEWVTDDSRKEGDITFIESASTTVNGYYVVYFVSSNDNTFPLANVRHILLNHEGGTTDENGATTYSDEEKAATLAKAEELLAAFTAGEATEDAFAALANENSDDTGSNTTGGLYENVYPGQMVTNFNDWCFDASRQPGDTGIVESEYGYHIMYFVGQSETTYRDHMIKNELTSTDMEQWQASLTEAAVVNTLDTSKVKKDLYLTNGN